MRENICEGKREFEGLELELELGLLVDIEVLVSRTSGEGGLEGAGGGDAIELGAILR